MLEACQLGAAIVFVLSMAYAAWTDLRSFEIANRVSVVVVLGFVVAAFAKGWPIGVLGMHLGVGAAVLIVGAALFFVKLMGGGDAKLLAAVAVWAGWDGIAAYLFMVVIAGGVLALAVLAFRATRLPERRGWWEFLRRVHDREQGLPYGIAIAVAAIISSNRWPIFPEF